MRCIRIRVFSLLNFYAGRTCVFRTLRTGIVKGRLVVNDHDGSYTFGSDSDGAFPVVTVDVLNSNLWIRVMTSNDIGGEYFLPFREMYRLNMHLVSEAFMNGDFDASSLKDLLNVWLCKAREKSHISDLLTALARQSHHSVRALDHIQLYVLALFGSGYQHTQSPKSRYVKEKCGM